MHPLFRDGAFSPAGVSRRPFARSGALAALLLSAIAGSPAEAQTLTVTAVPVGVAVNPATNKIYVLGRSLTVIDGATNATTTLAVTGSAIAVNATTNEIYVCTGSGTTSGGSVTVIDGATNAITVVPTSVFNAAAIAVNPATNKIYVANANAAGSVTVLDGATNAVATLSVGDLPAAIAINSVTNQIYVASGGAPIVSVIDGATNAVTNVNVASSAPALAVNSVTNQVWVASSPVTVINGSTDAIATVAAGDVPTSIAVNSMTDTIYVTAVAASGGALTQPGTLAVINGATTTAATIAAGIYPKAVAINPSTNIALIANEFGNNATEFNGATNAIATVTTGTNPDLVAVDPATNQFYVVNSEIGTVTVVPGPAGTPVTPPAFTTSPTNQSAGAGQSVTFTAAVSGSPTYQWLFNGAPIAGATNASLTLNNIAAASAGTYALVATNGGGSVTASATLTVSAVSAPAFTTQPVSQTVVSGTTVVFNSTASGSPAPTFQWKLNGTNVSGATTARLVVTSGPSTVGTYTCVATNSQGSATSIGAALNLATTTNVGRLVNLSVNTTAGKSQVLTVGFVTGGAGTAGSQNLLIRATGPALAALGVQNVLADPVLTVFSGLNSITSNDNWGTSQAAVTAADNATGAFALTNPASLDAALVASLSEGGYTVQITGNTAPSGTTLAEVYDDTAANAYTLATPRLINISSNNLIAANGSMTAGFVIGGTTSKTVLIRATGPALAVLGVQGTMPDPQLALHTTINNEDTVLATNAGWGGDPQIATVSAAVGAFPLTSATSKDSVVLVTLPPGAYTAIASSVTGTAGIVLIEVYEMP